MIEQYGIYYKENPSQIFEIIRAGNIVEEECPVFYHMGAEFPCEDFGVRKLTKREIEKLVLPTIDENHVERVNNEYSTWVKLNDENEELGNEYFYIGETKYYTINREEFKELVNVAKNEGKHLFTYRGREFSVYHLC
jgi:hypothetical protein